MDANKKLQMSATKNKAIEKLNEPAKPTAARKKQIKKAVTAVVERQAVEVAPAEVITVTAEPVKEPEPVEEVEQPTEPTLTSKQKVAALWAENKGEIIKICLYALAVALFAFVICDWIRVTQINNQLRQTQQVESKVADEKTNLGQTEANLSHMQQIKRSAETLNATIDSMQQITAREAEEHQRVYDLAKKYKLQNYELQNLIRDANDSTLRAYGSKPSN